MHNTITGVWNSNASWPDCGTCGERATCAYSWNSGLTSYACQRHDPTHQPGWAATTVAGFTYTTTVLPQIQAWPVMGGARA